MNPFFFPCSEAFWLCFAFFCVVRDDANMLSTSICIVLISVDKEHCRKALFTAPSEIMEVLAQVWCFYYSMIAYRYAYIEAFLQVWCSK